MDILTEFADILQIVNMGSFSDIYDNLPNRYNVTPEILEEVAMHMYKYPGNSFGSNPITSCPVYHYYKKHRQNKKLFFMDQLGIYVVDEPSIQIPMHFIKCTQKNIYQSTGKKLSNKISGHLTQFSEYDLVKDKNIKDTQITSIPLKKTSITKDKIDYYLSVMTTNTKVLEKSGINYLNMDFLFNAFFLHSNVDLNKLKEMAKTYD